MHAFGVIKYGTSNPYCKTQKTSFSQSFYNSWQRLVVAIQKAQTVVSLACVGVL